MMIHTWQATITVQGSGPIPGDLSDQAMRFAAAVGSTEPSVMTQTHARLDENTTPQMYVDQLDGEMEVV